MLSIPHCRPRGTIEVLGIRRPSDGLCLDAQNLSKFDASDLVRGWKDHDWATNFQLGRLGVCALGITENYPGGGAWEKWMTEVDSIALP